MLAIPRWQGRRGHPILFQRQAYRRIPFDPTRFAGESGNHPGCGCARWVDVDDPGILNDVDNPAAYRRLIETT